MSMTRSVLGTSTALLSYVTPYRIARPWLAQARRTIHDGRRASSSSSSVPPAEEAGPAIRQHTLSLVQNYDYPNYLSAFFYPQDVRYDYLAIRAFNVELSNIADSIRNQHLGRLRFQWWREAIASLNTANPTPHLTVQALYSLHRRRKLSLYHLNRLIDAKEQNMLDPAYSTLDDLTKYAQSTSMSLLLLQLSLLKPTTSTHKIQDIPLSTIDHSLSHLATYITIAQTIRSLPYFISKRTVVLPRDVAASHGVVDEALFRSLAGLAQEQGREVRQASKAVAGGRGNTSEHGDAAWEPAISACQELVSLAELERSKARWTLGLEQSGDDEHAQLAQGRSLSRLPAEVAPVFLDAIVAKTFFNKLHKVAHGNPFHPALRVGAKRDWKLPFQIWWANYRGQF